MNKKITMVDSGAYAVWQSQKDIIDVQAYGEYLVRERDYYEHCVNLDVIPSTPKREPSDELPRLKKFSLLVRCLGDFVHSRPLKLALEAVQRAAD